MKTSFSKFKKNQKKTNIRQNGKKKKNQNNEYNDPHTNIEILNKTKNSGDELINNYANSDWLNKPITSSKEKKRHKKKKRFP